MKLKADMREYLKNAVVARKDEISPSKKTTSVQIYGLEK